MLTYFPVNPDNKRPLVKKWQYHKGKAEGTYGVTLDSNTLVVDVDPRNGGLESESTLDFLGALTPTKIVTTASGGRHYYYLKPSTLMTKKRISDYPGVDFQTKGSYVIGEGSIIRGVTYVSNNEKIAEASPELLSIIEKKVEVSTVSGDMPEFSEKELEEMLNYLPSQYYTNYHLWTQIGMCLHDATNGSAVGLNLWDKWSKQSSKYEMDLCSSKWSTFKKDRSDKVTVGTLLSYAMKEGYAPSIEGTTLSSLERPERKDFYTAIQELSNWVYVVNIKRFFNLIDRRSYDVETMRLNYKRILPKGDPIKVILQNQYLTIADSFAFRPGEPQFIEEKELVYVNKWTPPTVKAKKGDASFFEAHLKWLLQDDWEILRNWMAWLVQRPTQRLTWAIVLTGGQGVGKSYFGSVMHKLLGEDNVSFPSNEGMHEKYNAWAADKHLVVVNELMGTGRRDLMNKLKTLITDSVIAVREMHSAEYFTKAAFSIFICSNYDAPLVLDSDDRRFCILKSYRVRKDRDYYNTLWNWTFDNLGVIKDYLMSVDLSQFDSVNAPTTFAKESLIRDTSYTDYREVVDEWVTTNDRKIFTLEEITQVLQKESEDFEYLDSRKVASILRGSYQSIKRIRINGKLQRLYAHYQDVFKVKGLSPKQLSERWKDELTRGDN